MGVFDGGYWGTGGGGEGGVGGAGGWRCDLLVCLEGLEGVGMGGRCKWTGVCRIPE